MKKILVVTTFNNHFNFFYRLSNTLKSFDFETHFITNKYSIIKEAQTLGVKIFRLAHEKSNTMNVNVHKSFEVAVGFLSENKAENIAASVDETLKEITSEEKYEYMFLWGGVRLIELVASEFATAKGMKTLFFELGNFPGKVFVDPKGTNAKSLLAEKPNILSSFEYDLDVYKEWSESYISNSLKKHSVPQSSSAVNIEYMKNVYDLIGYRTKHLLQTEPIVTKEKIIGKYLRKFVKLEYDSIDLKKTSFLFYPMQVNKDAQLILNSRVGNLEALHIVNDLAKQKKLTLLVKPHPGEVEFGFIKRVNSLKEKLGFNFVNDNTIELISLAEDVVTINSTVGLQAKIAGKEVKCLGKAFYQDFDEQMMAAYIQNYLINAEFWNEAPISKESAQQILSRAELN